MMIKWDAKIGGNGSEFKFDVHKEFRDLSGDIISCTDFGSNFIEGKRIFELQERQVALLLQALRHVYIPGFKKNECTTLADKARGSVRVGERSTKSPMIYMVPSFLQIGFVLV
ncbi:hypothetical protein OSB04_005422 [Centaurea solstitialis]|uniref:Uncharacterized protein n=1 Tax=Centaurea solstitialis TaxID=347529 RepID=A0AA38TZ42_9ASTR|nr:hypothetical protein OSB04_005422 [Centaurea solstitialis]